MKNVLLAACVVLVPSVSLPAQKLLLPADPGRIVQVFDLGAPEPGPAQKLAVPGAPPQETVDSQQRTTDLLARFVKPPLGSGDDLRVLGGRWLTLLGSAEQAASLEALFAVAAKHRTTAITLEMRFLDVKADAFAKDWAARLRPVEGSDGKRHEQVLGKDAAVALLTDLTQMQADQMQAPGITVLPLRVASMSTSNQTAYVKDFRMIERDGKTIAEPIVDVVTDGLDAAVCATLLADGSIALAADVLWQELQRPIPVFTSKVGAAGVPLQIQLPEVHGLRLQQTAAIADGGMVVLASQKADGSYLVATIGARTQPL